MLEERAKRKLTAILSADVKGYSRLMGEDEFATVNTLKEYRIVISSQVEQFSGRVVDSPGDNILAEFGSVVDAVECAVKIQDALDFRNEQLTENRQMVFRIGVNLGDVIHDEGRIYGDGVNVAARVEGLAEGGGICISGTAFDQVGKKLKLGYKYLGEQEVKNIEDPIRVYSVLTTPEFAGKVFREEKPKPISRPRTALAALALLIIAVGVLAIWHFYLRPPPIETTSVGKTSLPIHDKPSIAVLPFDNMSGDPKQVGLADGIVEEIITALSKTPKLLVIARNSTFTYKNKPTRVHRIGQELGVEYVLEGSVRKDGEKVRVTAQLIDAKTEEHLWADRYDRDLGDLFGLTDEITMKIVTALRLQLTEGEQALLEAKGTTNLDAYLKVMEAKKYGGRINLIDNQKMRRRANEAIALDPDYPVAYWILGGTYMMDVWLLKGENPEQSLHKAEELAKKALSMDPAFGPAHLLLAQIFNQRKEFDKSILEAERAVELEPNGADAHFFLGAMLTFAGRPEEGMQIGKKAIRLNPYANGPYFHTVAMAYRNMGKYDESIAYAEKAVKRSPNSQLSRHILISCYSLAGRDEEARAHVKELLDINPKFCIKSGQGTYKDPAVQERIRSALRKAGVPDCTLK